MNSAMCKTEIVKWCINNKDFIKKQFVPIMPESEFAACINIKNWKRIIKEKTEHYFDDYGPATKCVERVFDCVPFDDQLRGYVITDINDKTILRVFVQGE